VPPINGVAYTSNEELYGLAEKRLRGQQKMRESISLGARPGQRWER